MSLWKKREGRPGSSLFLFKGYSFLTSLFPLYSILVYPRPLILRKIERERKGEGEEGSCQKSKSVRMSNGPETAILAHGVPKNQFY
ncbi:MAG: hypothetical protein A2W09_07850 [Deltaproteobacteria bacterium RBG_16_50_11]|nr:MAG: hypothetical protein A2W09_07850 [Deltaproteobacteria bacterium RBG_16_50_11]